MANKQIVKKTPIIDRIPNPDEVREMWKSLTILAIKTCAEVMESSQNDMARLSAAKEAIDRGWGKAHTIPSGEVRPGGRIEVLFGEPPEVK